MSQRPAALGLVLWLSAWPLAALDLQLPGVYRAKEVFAKTGETWWGLFGDSAPRLEQVKIKVEEAQDPILDVAEDRSSRRVTAPGDPVALLRGLKLEAGPLSLAAAPQALRPEQPIPLAGDQPATLEVACRPADFLPDDPYAPCFLRLSRGGRSLDLADFLVERTPEGEYRWSGEFEPRLLFAGDLDRDGQVDLLVDIANHYGWSVPTLFLSKAAAPRLIERVAERWHATLPSEF